LALEDRQLLSTWTVNSTGDSGTGSGLFGDLRYCINKASTGGAQTITFDKTVFNTPQTISLTMGNLVAQNSTLTIDGPAAGLTINGSTNNGKRILVVQSGITTISNITFSGGKVNNDYGGAIYVNGTLNVNYCTFSNDTAYNATNNYGGAIYNNGGTLKVNFSTFSNDLASNGYGGGLANYSGSATLSYCTFANNGDGHGVLTNNYEGGAIYNSATVNLINCTIANNTASFGGGIYNYSGTLTVQQSIIANNSGSGPNVYNKSTVTSLGNNLIGTTSDTFWIGTDKINVANPGLTPLNDYGGPTQTMAILFDSPAIGVGGQKYDVNHDQRGFQLDNPLDIGAFQAPNGWKNGSQLVVTSTADGSGVQPGMLGLRGAVDLASVLTGVPTEIITFNSTVFATPQTITLIKGQLELGVPPSQSAQTITISGFAMSGATAPAGVTVNAGKSTRAFQVDSGVTANISGLNITGGGGTADRGGGVLNLNSAILNLSYCTLSGNTGSTNGGGLSNYGTANLTNVTISGNNATGNGGGLFNFANSTLTLTNCTVSANTGAQGGGLFNNGTTTLTNSIVAGNTNGSNAASDIGVGTNVSPSSSNNMIGTGGAGGLTNGTNGNIVAPANLGLAKLDYYGGPTQTIALTPNSAAIGGVPAGAAGTPATDQRGFARNTAAKTDIGAFQTPNGWSTSTTLKLQVNTTSDPYALPNGYSLREAVSLANLANLPNTVATITFDPVVFAKAQTITLTQGQLALSEAGNNVKEVIEGSPAGVTVNAGGSTRVFQVDPSVNASISGLTITGGGGTADRGGGVLNRQGATLTLNSCTLSGNTGSTNGGGLANYGTANLTNVTVSGDKATGNGGGVFTASNSTLMLTDCTISANTGAQGGGLFNSGTTTLTDTIVAGNKNGSNLASDIGGSNVVSTSSYNLTGAGGSGGLGNGTNGNQTGVANPGLMVLGNYGGPTQTMALLPSSRAIGKGTVVNGITTDERGMIRGALVDIGAYQYSLFVESADGSVNTSPAQLTLPGAVSLTNAFGGTSGVTFNPAVFPGGQTINLTSTLEIKSNVSIFSITGPPNRVTLNGGTSRIFQVDKSVTANFSNLIMTSGFTGQGACLEDFGTANVTGTTFAGTNSPTSGAIEVSKGTLSLSGPVKVDNWQTGINIINNSTATITNAVINNNASGISVGASNSDSNTVMVTLTDLSSNTVGVQNNSSRPVGATLNWWGSSFGPNTPGASKTTQPPNTVEYSPWLADTDSLSLPTPDSIGFSSDAGSSYTVTPNPTAQNIQITSSNPKVQGKVTEKGTVLFYGTGGNVTINGEQGASFTTNAFTLTTSPQNASPLVTGSVVYTASDAFDGAQILFGGSSFSPTVNAKGTKTNTFDVSGWKGGGKLTALGAAANTVMATKTVNMTLTNNSISSTVDGMNLALTGINNASLTANVPSGGSVIVDASAFTGVTNLTAGGAGNAILFGGGSAGKMSKLTVSGDPSNLGTGNDILIGGPGINNLTDSGTGYNILIGGGGAGGFNTLQGNDKGNDILISSTTIYDSNTPANITALKAILAEWSSGADIGTRVNAITNGVPTPNGPYKLTKDTVTWNGKNNVLKEGTKPNQQNWFIVRVPGDNYTSSGSDKVTFLP
jgi:hypothetical protein